MRTSKISEPESKPIGLFAIIESKRVILPLKGVECDFSIVSGIVEVSMTQIFRQENENALDCEYLFPLPADASVFSCEADINGRIIRAQARERQEAHQITAEKKAAGFRTALVEAERDNLFTLSLGNVQPNDLIIVELKYIQTLRSVGELRSIEVPFCPGVRYIPGKPLLRSNKGKGIVDDTDETPDASRITPVRIDAEHPDAAYIEVRGALDGKFADESSIASPSHPIAVHRDGEELRIGLVDRADVPDRDFVLRWRERDADAVAPRVWIQEKDGEKYALLEIRAPKQPAPANRPGVDFYFLVDRSGSMQGEKWIKATEALQSCMRVLGPADRAMITFFESRFQDFAEVPMPVPQLLEDRQFNSISKIGTAGGTEMLPALQHVLEVASKCSRGRDQNLILITDAQIGNESAILDLMKSAPDLPVHCFGIDVALNDSLLLALCRQQGGAFQSLNPNDNIQQAVTALARTLGQPVLLDVKLSHGWEIADARIPNLYAGQIHYLSARSTDGKSLELTARKPSSEQVRMQFEQQHYSTKAPYLHWSRSRIQRLIAEGENEQAIALSVKSNLICTLTAFVAWDESEKVPVATHDLVQPSLQLAEFEYGAMPAAGAPMRTMFAKRSRSLSLFKEMKNHAVEPEQKRAIREPVPIDDLQLKRDLSDICHQIGVPDWQDLLKKIFAWIYKGKEAERARRIAAVSGLLEDLRVRLKRIEGRQATEQEKDQARQDIRALLQSFIKERSRTSLWEIITRGGRSAA
ncbi:MAG TPA: VIT and VWA domain-containing protein [Verrucomicrobiae bacterium]